MTVEKEMLTTSDKKEEVSEFEMALQFSDLQGQRTAVFNDFNRGFQYFLKKEAAMHEYEHLVEAVTLHFRDISLAIQELIKTIREKWADTSRYVLFMEVVQSMEKNKLAMTVKLQTLQTETEFGEIDHSEQVAEMTRSIKESEEEITNSLMAMREIMLDEVDL
jgi:hypothetical protein